MERHRILKRLVMDIRRADPFWIRAALFCAVMSAVCAFGLFDSPQFMSFPLAVLAVCYYKIAVDYW